MQQINTEFNRGNRLSLYRSTQYYTSSGGPFSFPSAPISFSNFYGTQVNSPFVVSIAALPDMATASGAGPTSLTSRFSPNGNWLGFDTQTSTPDYTGTWVTPIVAGTGINYWVRMTITSQDGPSEGNVNYMNIPYTWTSMATVLNPQMVFFPSGPFSGGCRTIWTAEISTDFGGVNIVATRTNWNWLCTFR
jgi:hypothetical protein